MAHADPHGHYRVLNVAPHASAAAIDKAFRRRMRELDPARNRQMGAAERHQAVVEAHRVLSDPLARADYDTLDLTRAAPGAPPTDDPVACGRCKRVSAQPRYLIFRQVIGRLTRVFHDRVQGIYCPRCARDVALGCSLLTWFVGWWGFPDGPVASARAIGRNMRGGEMPAGPNARLLAHQARAFAARERPELARALAALARGLDPEAAAGAAPLAEGDGPAPALRDPWKTLTRAAPAHLLPAFLLVLVVVMLGPFRPGGGGEAPADPLAGRAPGAGVLAPGRVAGGRVVLRAGPGVAYPAVAQLGRLDGAAVLGPGRDGWVPIRLEGLSGFVRLAEVGERPGSEGLYAWCRDHRGERPESGTVLRRSGEGHAVLAADNPLSTDALLKLRDGAGAAVVAVYLRAGEGARVTGLPAGPLSALYATGSEWSGPCGTFLTDLAVYTLPGGAHAVPEAQGTGAALALGGPAAGAVRGDPVGFASD